MVAPPVIGISGYLEAATWRAWRDVPAVLLPHAYVRHVQQAGAIAVVLPWLAPASNAAAATLLDRLDGLVLSGGVDVEASRYGERAHAAAQPPRPERDASELALARAAAERDLPMLGICRGMQVMAVAAGGVLYQHLPELLGHSKHSPGTAEYGTTAVHTEPGSLVGKVLGDGVEVVCSHHQGVAAHPGYVASAWAEDGTVEAMEAPDARWRVGVQWHPEAGEDPRLFEALVNAAQRQPG